MLAEERAILSEVVARTPAAIALIWGADHRIRLLNDRWLETFPARGATIDRTLEHVLPEVGSLLAPLLDRVYMTGEAFRGTDLPFPFGGPESLAGYRYFTFTVSPVSGLGDGIGGVLVVGTETTDDVRRQHHIESELATERGIADVLQRSLLPVRLPQLPGIALAARYMPGSTGVEVGGDWYDVIPLGGDRLGLVIGDVTGHGIQAASIMGQLRHALRAYAVEGHPPAKIIERLDYLLEQQDQMATVLYAVFEVSTGTLVYVSAGHPPMLLASPEGSVRYLAGPRHAPLGTMMTAEYQETTVVIPPNATLLFYTDGLVEARGRSMQEGLDRLFGTVGGAAADLESLCDQLLDRMHPEDSRDDVAILALATIPLSTDRLRLQLAARPSVLPTLRPTLMKWLSDSGANKEEAQEIVVATSEACMNAIEHAYALASDPFEVELIASRGEIMVTVRDRGRWREPRGRERGYGFTLMRALTDDLVVESTAGGTEVHMRRLLQKTSR
jgi:anti-sigma regulatory factor (Ser/Thr protein kinase)